MERAPQIWTSSAYQVACGSPSQPRSIGELSARRLASRANPEGDLPSAVSGFPPRGLGWCPPSSGIRVGETAPPRRRRGHASSDKAKVFHPRRCRYGLLPRACKEGSFRSDVCKSFGFRLHVLIAHRDAVVFQSVDRMPQPLPLVEVDGRDHD